MDDGGNGDSGGGCNRGHAACSPLASNMSYDCRHGAVSSVDGMAKHSVIAIFSGDGAESQTPQQPACVYLSPPHEDCLNFHASKYMEIAVVCTPEPTCAFIVCGSVIIFIFLVILTGTRVII